MNIAFLLGQFPALSETFILNQITGLIDRGHSVSIFAERPGSDEKPHPDVERYRLQARYESLPDAPWRRLAVLGKPDAPLLRSLNMFRHGMQSVSLRLPWAANLFRNARDFDIVQCHFGALGLKAALLRDAGALSGKIVTAFHGEDIVNYPRRFHGNIYAPLFASGDLFLPVSDRWNSALIAMGCPPDRIRMHRMGVDIERFHPGPPDSGPLRIITVARLAAKKGISDALRAVAKLRADFEFAIIGDGPLRPNLQNLAAELGIGERVRFEGACTHAEIPARLRSATIFLLPSTTGPDGDIEGIPVSMMEAMASGLPVVATRHSAIPELVADGVSGFLAAEQDVEGLARALQALADHPELSVSMGRQGRRIVERDFAIAPLNERLLELYKSI